MSQINIWFNFFLGNKDICNLSTQELFSFYKIFKKRYPRLNFFQFSVLALLFFETFKSLKNTYLFFNLLYFSKTPAVLKVTSIYDLLQARLATGSIISVVSNPELTLIRLNFFWKRFKKLRRPKTDEDFSSVYLTDYQNKLDKYNGLGLLYIINSLSIVRAKTEVFFKNSVIINKPLLVAPKLSSSSIYKFINVADSNNMEFQFLRKNKVYNKGRYSRCRQNYRTGVYMCMYLSVVSIFGLYYWFYKFSFNFTYLWWLFICFIGSFFLPKIIKYRLYEPITLFNKFFDFFKWLFLVIKSIFF